MFQRPASPTYCRKLLDLIDQCDLDVGGGCCFGYAMMAVQAVLLQDTASFDKRMAQIYKTSAPELKKRMDDALHPVALPLSIEEKSKQQTYIDMQAFITNIALYQNPLTYHYLFPVDESNILQDALHAADIVLPQKLIDAGGLNAKRICYGLYRDDELDRLLDTLFELLRAHHINFPIALTLNNANHALTLGYDTKFDGWMYLEVHDGISHKISRERIVATLNKIFSSNEYLALAITLHITGNQAKLLAAVISEFQSSDDYKRCHNLIARRLAASDSHQTGLLYMAVANNDAKLLVSMLGSPLVDVNQVSDNGVSPLHYAVINNCVDCLKVLLEDTRINVNLVTGFDVNDSKSSGNTALHLAVENNRLECLSLLLKRTDIDIDMPNKSGATALMLAAVHNHVEAAKKILAAYPESVHTVIEGMNAYDAAKISHNWQMMKLLQSHMQSSARKSFKP